MLSPKPPRASPPPGGAASNLARDGIRSTPAALEERERGGDGLDDRDLAEAVVVRTDEPGGQIGPSSVQQSVLWRVRHAAAAAVPADSVKSNGFRMRPG